MDRGISVYCTAFNDKRRNFTDTLHIFYQKTTKNDKKYIKKDHFPFKK